MGNNPWQIPQIGTVAQAQNWAHALTCSEIQGAGDIAEAWRRLSTRYGVPARLFWSLRYRPPKTIAADLYLRLCEAYRAECERQMWKLQHELDQTKTIAGADHAALDAATALVAEGAKRRA